MILNTASAFLGMMAMGQPSGSGQSTAPWYWNMLMPGLLLFAFYFVILRPQKNRQKAHDTLMKSVKAGDKVVTTSGIIGIVVTVKERSVSIRSADTKLEVLKTAISEITEREGEPSQSPA